MAGKGLKTFMGILADKTGAPPLDSGDMAAGGRGDATKDPMAEVGVDEFKADLKQIAWVPVLAKPPHPLVPWTDAHSEVACPAEVRPKEDLWLLSTFMRILDADVASPELRRDLGWEESGDRTLIAAQLVKLTQIPGVAQLPDLQAQLNGPLLRIYASLQAAVGTEAFADIQGLLLGVPWVWLGDDFAAAEAVAFTCALNARPMLCAVPAELYAYGRLLRALGVRDAFAGPDYVRALAHMARTHAAAPLPAAQLDVAVAMVQYIADDRHSLADAAADAGNVFVPDVDGVLRYVHARMHSCSRPRVSARTGGCAGW